MGKDGQGIDGSTIVSGNGTQIINPFIQGDGIALGIILGVIGEKVRFIVGSAAKWRELVNKADYLEFFTGIRSSPINGVETVIRADRIAPDGIQPRGDQQLAIHLADWVVSG